MNSDNNPHREITLALKKEADPEKASVLQRFFKTGKGEYGEGDVFYGIAVPVLRELSIKFKDTKFTILEKMLDSEIHEERMLALFVLVRKFEKGNENEKKAVFKTYFKKKKRVNNWDLVDLSAPKIVGAYLEDKDRSVLYKLVASKNLWEKRIAVISTFTFIKRGDFKDALNLSEILLCDKHDLIHKATGWMLREVGKRDSGALENFLDKHCRKMPRTMLRYSVERLQKRKREKYMKGTL
ncbi:DNA alkylation repair protein [candidate division WOR-3 bacterium]|nr:DNA alkylation repair protein [candidate division WOR-3 bacterium]